MKICTIFGVHPKYNPGGGAERQMLLLAEQLIKRDVEFHYIYNKNHQNQKNYEIIDGIKVHGIGRKFLYSRTPRKIREKIINELFYKHYILVYKKFFKRDFDIYHLESASILKSLFPFLLKKIKKKKFIFTIPSIMFCEKKSLPWGILEKRIYNYNIKIADLVIVLADYMKKALYQNFGIKSIVIKSGNPIPEGPFEKDFPPTVLWFSRLVKGKRPEIFLKIAKALEDLDANFLLIGPREYKKQEIMNFAKKYKNFTFIPGVPFGEDDYFYERATLFVNTSLNQEGFPNSFIQAWLRETPVISLEADPDCDICKHGLGYHAKGNIEGLIKKIKELVENPSKLKDIGKKCRKYAIKNHDIKKTAEQHYKLYKWLLKN